MISKRKAWAVMLAAYLAGVAIALNQSKVPPVMSALMADLHIDAVTGGWLMSAFAVAGIVLGIPAALILGKLGPKLSGSLALGCTLLGSIIGALANSAGLLLIGRAIEGVGLGLITVVAPAVISLWFAPHERGMPMGIWASWVPVGSIIMLNMAGPLQASFGWQGSWWFGAAFALVALIVYAVFVSAPASTPSTHAPSPAVDSSFGKLLFNPASWLLALMFGAFNFAFMAVGAWSPMYFNQGLGVDPNTASFDASVPYLAVIPAMLIAGWVFDRVKNRHRVLTLAFAVCSIGMLWCFQLGSAAVIVPYMIVLGFSAGFIPTAAFTLAPETMPDPRFAGLALGVVSVGQNLGLSFGPPVVGALIANGNWAAGIGPVAVASAIGVAASIGLQISHTRRLAL
ncbi:MAG: MFS transporter [Chloroflexi bacterium]|nr:MFS transporter [Chloroflexota bacterium]